MRKTEVKSLRVLYIEDNRGDFLLLESCLLDFPHIQIVNKPDMKSAIGWLQGETPDIVLLDLGLPDTQGLDGLLEIRNHFPDICVIVISGNEDFQLSLKAVSEGAQDYILKSKIEQEYLYKTLFQAHERNFLYQQLRKREEELEQNQDRLQLALKAGKIGVLDFDILTGIATVNETYYEVIGHSKDQYEPSLESFSKILYPEDRDLALQVLSEITKGNLKHVSEKYRVFDSNGNLRWIGNNGLVVFENGKAVRLVSMIKNITKKIQTEREVLRATIKAQEAERARISADIHDGLQQLLVATKINFDAISLEVDQLSGSSLERFKKAHLQLDQAVNDARQIAHELMPKVIQDFGLVEALHSMIQNSPEGVTIEFYENLKGARLPSEIEITLFRIIQESMSNILKQGKARKVNLQVMLVNQKVTLTIEDNGMGFNLKEKSDTMGLQSLRNRATAAGGILEIDSTPDAGTNILVEIPL